MGSLSTSTASDRESKHTGREVYRKPNHSSRVYKRETRGVSLRTSLRKHSSTLFNSLPHNGTSARRPLTVGKVLGMVESLAALEFVTRIWLNLPKGWKICLDRCLGGPEDLKKLIAVVHTRVRGTYN
jgi:hypothetical protein